MPDIEHEIRKETWARNNRFNEFANEHLAQSGYKAVSMAMIINGAAAVALLGFLANGVSSELGIKNIDFEKARWALTAFGLGVLSAALAAGGTYLTNSSYLNENAASKFIWEHPYIEKTDKSKKWRVRGNCLLFTIIVSVLVAYAAFLFGLLTAADIFSPAVITANG